jgi:hypothetical protein
VKPIEARAGLGTGVGGHDHDHVTEVRLAPVVVGQRTVVHHLQQQVEDFRMRLLDFIEQQHAVRLLGDGFGQQTALIEPDIARRRTDQTRYGVALHVLGHVETTSSTPSALASWRAASVLPTPVGPANRNEPTGLSAT